MTQSISQSTRSKDIHCARTINSPLPKLSRLTVGSRRIQDLISFRTEHELHPSGHPVDSYTFHTAALAIDPTTNQSVDITQFTIASSLGGFTITRVASVPAYGTDDSMTMGIEPLAMDVEYRPSKSSGAFIMCALVMSWTLTLVSVYVSLVAMTKGKVDFTTVILHAFTVLAILGLWEGWLGKQSFGAHIGNS